ncbi:S8 family serine peptidase [Loktanella sp. DJP18]|uniref:S8 family serine peptidase n=1 Tax=Loktanella sp. DJP18 TaxID=3409788 RepID=UPI003BB57196
MTRTLWLLFLAGLIGLGPVLASGPGASFGAALAQDDDDDDGDDGDDDDDDDRPRRAGPADRDRDRSQRIIRAPQRRVQQAAPTPQRRVQQPAPRPAPPPPPPPVAVPNEIVVLALADADLAALQAQGFTLIEERSLESLDAVARRLRTPQGVTLTAARDLVRAQPSGTTADLNHYYRSEQGFDPGCAGIDCPIRTGFGWTLPTDRAQGCGAGLRIGVVDTGLNPDHETFAGADLTVLDFAPLQDGASRALHGTAVAALLVGRPDTRSPGLVPQASVVAIDPFHRTGGDERADVFSLLDAIDRVAQQDVGVLNLSLAGPPNAALTQLVRHLVTNRDIVVVAAAGNAGPRAKPQHPAAIAEVLAVTAVDRDQQVYRRAVQGVHIDLAAPGVDVWTAASVSGARPKTGTSFAVPFVTAAAGLLRLAEPDLSAVAVKARLKAAATDLGPEGMDPVFGAGLVPAADATCRIGAARAMPAPLSAPMPAAIVAE